jgi:hypothetical protein
LIHAFRVPLRDRGQVFVLFNMDESQLSRTVTLTDCQPPITLIILRKRPALVWFDGRGALRAVETQGDFVMGNEHVLTDHTSGILLALDGKDLRRSRALVLMPLKPGAVRWTRAGPWRGALVETGEFHNGTWQPFETSAVINGNHEVSVNVTADQVFSLLLVCDRADAPRWRKALERALNDPESLP